MFKTTVITRILHFVLYLATGAVLVLGLSFAIAQQRERVKVVVETAQVEAIVEQLPLNGSVTSARVSPVSTQIAGKVDAMFVDDGSYVEAGATLVKLDRRLAQLALRQAEAATRAAAAALADAERRLDMARNLKQGQVVSEDELQRLRTEVETDGAELARLKAAQEQQALLLALHEIKAPFSGVVSRRLTEAGAWIDPGSAVVELVDMERLRIDVPVPQEYFSRLNKEMNISVALKSQPEKQFAASLQNTIPVADATSRTFIARVTPIDDAAALMPGLSAKVTMHLATGARDVVVSRDALLRYPDGRTVVWVAKDKDNGPTVSERLVTTGKIFNGKVQILEGLTEGERVVVQGNEALRENQAVQLENGG